jgi:hypothetical protein
VGDGFGRPLAGRAHFAPSCGLASQSHSQEAVKGNPKPKVGGAQTLWLPGHVAIPTGHHLVSYQLNQVGNPSLDPYKYAPTGGNQYTTLYL